MRRSVSLLAALSATALIAAGCSQPAETGGGGDDGGGGDGRSQLSIATGGTTGVYYPLGGAISQVIGDAVDGASASVESTGASVENVRLVGGGDAQLAIAQGDAVDQGNTGTGDFEGDETPTRALAVLYPNVYHAVTLQQVKESEGLDCFSDVEDVRYSIGDVGSGNEATTRAIFDALGIDVEAMETRQMGYAETANALSSGQLDAGSWVVGEGHSGITELGTTENIALVPLCDDERATVVDEYGYYTEHTIAAGTYPGIDQGVDTIAVWNVLIASPDFGEDQAYEITKAIYENTDVLAGVYAPGEQYFVPETIQNSPVPVHPGAQRYYEEAGVELSDELTE